MMRAGSLPKLIVITDPALALDEFLDRMRPVLALGPEVAVQVRLPGASGRAIYDYASRLITEAAAHENPVFVNGRIDVALALRTHVHLPVDAPRPRELRALFPSQWISVAVHNLEEARTVVGADLALVSPVFAPTSKPEDARMPLGPEGFAQLARSLECPAFALGGVNVQNAAALRGLARGFAVIGAVLHSQAPRIAAQTLLAALAD